MNCFELLVGCILKECVRCNGEEIRKGEEANKKEANVKLSVERVKEGRYLQITSAY